MLRCCCAVCVCHTYYTTYYNRTHRSQATSSKKHTHTPHRWTALNGFFRACVAGYDSDAAVNSVCWSDAVMLIVSTLLFSVPLCSAYLSAVFHTKIQTSRTTTLSSQQPTKRPNVLNKQNAINPKHFRTSQNNTFTSIHKIICIHHLFFFIRSCMPPSAFLFRTIVLLSTPFLCRCVGITVWGILHSHKKKT